MKPSTLLLVPLLFAACSHDGVTGFASKSDKIVISPTDPNKSLPPTESVGRKGSQCEGEECAEVAQCADRLGVNAEAVTIHDQTGTISLSPSDVVFLRIIGLNESISLDLVGGTSFISIRGLCVSINGTSRVLFNIDAQIGTFFYRGVGQSQGVFSLSPSSALSSKEISLTNEASLEIRQEDKVETFNK